MEPANVKEEMIAHCRDKFKSINKDYLKKHGIKSNLFLEIMYDTCLGNYYKKSDFRLDNEDLESIWVQARNQATLMEEYINGKVILSAISDNDHFFFKIMRKIEQTNTEPQTNNE